MTTREKMQTLVESAKRTDLHDYSIAVARLQDERVVKLLHAAMGLCTEAGEFMDMIKRHVFYGKPIDTVNAIEELGDITWYERIGVDALEADYLAMIERNVDKLRARYPDKFTEDKATNRDLDAERKVLEA